MKGDLPRSRHLARVRLAASRRGRAAAGGLRVDERGRVGAARYVPSPNFDERPPGQAIDLIVIHAISLPPGRFGGPDIEKLFCNSLDVRDHPAYASLSGLRVSAHFLIRRDGELLQFVPCHLRAWHAGKSRWKRRSRCNDFSIGIELEGADDHAFGNAQYRVLAALTHALAARYPIREIVAHSDIAPGRKTDPGPRFAWGRYRALLMRPRARPRAGRVRGGRAAALRR